MCVFVKTFDTLDLRLPQCQIQALLILNKLPLLAWLISYHQSINKSLIIVITEVGFQAQQQEKRRSSKKTDRTIWHVPHEEVSSFKHDLSAPWLFGGEKLLTLFWSSRNLLPLCVTWGLNITWSCGCYLHFALLNAGIRFQITSCYTVHVQYFASKFSFWTRHGNQVAKTFRVYSEDDDTISTQIVYHSITRTKVRCFFRSWSRVLLRGAKLLLSPQVQLFFLNAIELRRLRSRLFISNAGSNFVCHS